MIKLVYVYLDHAEDYPSRLALFMERQRDSNEEYYLHTNVTCLETALANNISVKGHRVEYFVEQNTVVPDRISVLVKPLYPVMELTFDKIGTWEGCDVYVFVQNNHLSISINPEHCSRGIEGTYPTSVIESKNESDGHKDKQFYEEFLKPRLKELIEVKYNGVF